MSTIALHDPEALPRDQVLVAVHRTASLISKAIRWQTRSEFSHASLIYNGQVLEAIEGKGVVADRRVETLPLSVCIMGLQRVLSDAEHRAVWAFAERQLGKGYDMLSVLHFITRRPETRSSSGRWYCSELAHAAFLHGANVWLQRMESWRASPDHIAISTALQPIAGDPPRIRLSTLQVLRWDRLR